MRKRISHQTAKVGHLAGINDARAGVGQAFALQVVVGQHQHGVHVHIAQLRSLQALAQGTMLPPQLVTNVLGLVVAVVLQKQTAFAEHIARFDFQHQHMPLGRHHGQVQLAKPLHRLMHAGPRQAMKHIEAVGQPHPQHLQQRHLTVKPALLGGGG